MIDYTTMTIDGGNRVRLSVEIEGGTARPLSHLPLATIPTGDVPVGGCSYANWHVQIGAMVWVSPVVRRDWSKPYLVLPLSDLRAVFAEIEEHMSHFHKVGGMSVYTDENP